MRSMDPTRSEGQGSDTGGPQVQPELVPPLLDVVPEEVPELNQELEDGQEPADANQLDVIRRAVAMDRGDQDMLPDF